MATVMLATIAGCGGAGDDDGPPTPPPETTERPGGPSGGGRPDVGDGDGGVALETVGDFDDPVYVTQPPDERESLYVVERCGRILRTPVDGGDAETFLDLSGEVGCEGSEQGLLSVAFAPDHARSGLLYVYFTDADGTARVVEFQVADEVADPDSARELLAIEDFAPNHNGGLLAFDPDGALWIGTGDGGGAGDPERTAQDLSSPLGKLLRIDPAADQGDPYGIPRDNPHAGDPDARPEVAVHGLRNPWRYSFDRETGDLWIGDVGQAELEEIDSVPAAHLLEGADFGWSAYEGSQRFNDDQEAPDALAPTLEYDRSDGECSVTGGYVVRDESLPSLYGRYLYGDYCTGELRSFVARPGEPAADDRPLGLGVAALSSFGEDASGGIYAVSLEGTVSRLVAEAPSE